MIDFKQVLTNFDASPITDEFARMQNGGIVKELTLGDAASHALCGSFPDEQNISGEDKFKRGMLAMRIKGNESFEPTVEEVALIKRLIAKSYGPLVVLKAWQLLDPAQA